MVKEMDSSRRPFDRSREPGLKKPRLSDEVERSRSFLQRPVAQQRFRTSDRDSASSDLGEGGYQPQPLPHQELVSQYKTALAELTFNSKPIITNLTIIAGENLMAAKAIAATVCFNILEVPSEQKLPSLYLLDSIVKNIGRDYIKYFAPRLPEVFCMAYGQVDLSVQSSMRHLFGTWKGVFPAQTLQIIEKELAFTSTSGSSSGGINSRPDLQAQRPPHSIHVNPKYLERQHLQQSKVKGATSDVNVITKNSNKVPQRPERATNISVGRPWVDAPVKMLDSQHSLKTTSEIAPEKNTNASCGEYERNSFSRSSGLGKKIDNGREKPWFGAGSNVEETTSGQRNGFNRKLGLSTYPVPIPKSASSGKGLPTMQGFVDRNNNELSSSWKNSEEEEYSWDDMNSRLADHGLSSIARDLRKDQWTPDSSDKLGYENRLHKPPSISDVAVRVDRESSSDSLSSEQREVGALGQQLPLPWQIQEEHSSGDPINSGTPGLGSGYSEGSIRIPVLDARSSGQVQMGKSLRGSSTFGSSGAVGKRIDSLSSSLSSRQSPIIQYHHSHQLHNLAEEELQKIQSLPRHDLKASSYSGTLSIGQSNNYSQESVHVQFPKFSQPRDLQALTSSVPASQPKCHFPVSQPLEPESMQPSQAQKSLRLPVRDPRKLKLGNSLSGNVSEETSEESSTRDLLAAVMKSGILSNNSVNSSQSGISLKEIEKRAPELEMQPDWESGSPPADFMSSRAKVSGASLLGLSSFERTSFHSKLSPSAVGQPSLLAPIAKSVSAETSNVSSKPSNAFSSLLSSLVAKGLISASNEDLANDNVSELSSQPEIQSSGGTCTSSMPVLSVPVSSASPPSTGNEISSQPEIQSSGGTCTSSMPVLSVPVSSASSPSTGNEIPSSKPDVKSDIILPESTMEIKGAIGFEFRPETIRKFHSSVISRLFDDIPYQCSICGIRYEDQEHLDGHLQWHATKEQEAHNLNKMSRRWYANSVDLNAQKAGLERAFSTEDCDWMDGNALMVPSDENQCLCILCGELFEDVYNLERDEWMFKGAVHLNIPLVGGELGRKNKNTARGPIVHANCVTESSAHDLGLVFNIKTERDI